MPIGGGRDFPATEETRRAWIERVAHATGLAPLRVETCLDRYGTSAEEMLEAGGDDSEGLLGTLPEYSIHELHAVIRQEQVVGLADLAFRRLPIAISGSLTRNSLAELAEIAADTLHWCDDETERQIEQVSSTASQRHGIDLDKVSSSPPVECRPEGHLTWKRWLKPHRGR